MIAGAKKLMLVGSVVLEEFKHAHRIALYSRSKDKPVFWGFEFSVQIVGENFFDFFLDLPFRSSIFQIIFFELECLDMARTSSLTGEI